MHWAQVCIAPEPGDVVLLQEPGKFLAWVRKVVLLYLQLLSQIGDLDTLQRAAAFLIRGLPFAEPECLLDLARWVIAAADLSLLKSGNA